MKSLLLTFDLEEFVCPAERKLGIPKERLFEVSREGLKNIIKILLSINIFIIFFNPSLLTSNNLSFGIPSFLSAGHTNSSKSNVNNRLFMFILLGYFNLNL